MEQEQLPIDEMKNYGIINSDNQFNDKLSASDIKNFLDGHIIVADNKNNRATFQLIENNSKLLVGTYKRDKNIDELLEASKNTIQYSKLESENISAGDTFKLKEFPNETFTISNVREQNGVPVKLYFEDEQGNEFNTSYKDFLKDVSEISKLNTEFKAFVYDEKTDKIIEYDLIKDIAILTKIVAERKKLEETNKYKNELLKLKGFLQDKIDKFPSIAKQITENMNIVSNEINSVNSISFNQKQANKQEKSEVRLDVNDPDLYQDANRHKEEKEEKEEQERRRGFRR